MKKKKQESNFCRLIMKGVEEHKEEILEATVSLAAAKQISMDAAVVVVFTTNKEQH